MTGLTQPGENSVQPAAMPLQVRLRRLPFAWRVSAPALIVVAAIPAGMGIWITVEQGAAEALLMPLVVLPVVLPLVPMMWSRARGLVLAADSAGIWFRPALDKHAAWLTWDDIDAVYVARFMTAPMLCIKTADPAIDEAFASRLNPASGRSANWILRTWRWRRLRTSVFVPVSYSDPDPDEILAGLRDLAAGRGSIG